MLTLRSLGRLGMTANSVPAGKPDGYAAPHFVILSEAQRSRRISRYAHLEIPRQARDDREPPSPPGGRRGNTGELVPPVDRTHRRCNVTSAEVTAIEIPRQARDDRVSFRQAPFFRHPERSEAESKDPAPL